MVVAAKRLRLLLVLEIDAFRARALRSWERGASGRWHIHCALELPSHFDAVTLEKPIRACWAKVEGACGRNSCPRSCECGLDQLHVEGPSEIRVDGFFDCIIIGSLHNPIVGA